MALPPALQGVIITDKSFYMSVDGRIGRKKFLINWVLPVIFIDIILEILSGKSAIFSHISILWWLITLVPSIIINAKRLHDFDHSGWWQLLLLIPFANIYIIICLLFRRSTLGANRFGMPPVNDPIIQSL